MLLKVVHSNEFKSTRLTTSPIIPSKWNIRQCRSCYRHQHHSESSISAQPSRYQSAQQQYTEIYSERMAQNEHQLHPNVATVSALHSSRQQERHRRRAHQRAGAYLQYSGQIGNG